MQTKIYDADHEGVVAIAAELLKDGQLVAVPTDWIPRRWQRSFRPKAVLRIIL